MKKVLNMLIIMGFLMLQIVTLAELSYGASSYIDDPSGDATPPCLDVVGAEVIEIGDDSIQLSMTLSGDVPQTVQSGFLKYIWFLDTDRNPATGQKHNYIGSEYNIHVQNYGESWEGFVFRIDLNNTIYGYWVGNGSVSVDGKVIKILVKKELIGSPSSFDWDFDTVSDISSGDEANGYATIPSSSVSDPLGDATPPYLDVVSVEVIEIDDSIQFSMTMAGDVPQTVQSGFLKYIWCLDTDRNRTTGQKRNYIGSEYHIHVENYGESWDGLIVKIDLKNTSVGYVIANGSVSISGKTIKIIVKTEQIGSPSSFDWEFDTFSDISSGDESKTYATMTLTSYSKPVSISYGKAIIVAGGGNYVGNSLWEDTKKCANYAQTALIFQGVSHDNITLISEKSKSVFKDAVTSWAKDAGDVLLIYMVDHGGDNTFRLNGFEKSEDSILSASELDEWLDIVQQTFKGYVVIIYDACESGSFVKTLKGNRRFIFTSTDVKESALFASNGILSFSWLFWSQFYNGSCIYDAFTIAKNSMNLVYSQNAQIDANGNGTPNEKEDSARIEAFCLGNSNSNSTGDDLPLVVKVSDTQNLANSKSAIIYAEVSVTTPIQKVWAVVRPPNYTNYSSSVPVTTLPFPIVELKQVGSSSRYEAKYDNFIAKGNYEIAIFATNIYNFNSLPKKTTVTQTQGSVCVFADNDLAMNICAVYQGVRYGFTMKFDDAAQLSWKMDVGTFRELQADPGNCISVGNDLKLDMCAEYQGKDYGFMMNYDKELIWKMDVGTFKLKE